MPKPLGGTFRVEPVREIAATFTVDRASAQDAHPSWVRDLLEQALASGEGVRVIEADWTTEECETARPGKVDWLFDFSCATFNLLRMPKLREQCA
jgi:hypothetical protein